MLLGRPSLGQILIKSGLISQEELNAALEHQALHGRRLGESLIALSYCTDGQIAESLAEQLQIPLVNLAETPPLPSCVAMIPPEIALQYEALPVRFEDTRLLVAVLDPFDIRIDDALQRVTGSPVLLAIAPEGQLRHLLLQHYGDNSFEAEAQPAKNDMVDLVEEDPTFAVEKLARVSEQGSTIRVVNALIADAVRRGASDLHFEPDETRVRIRYRVDGRLRSIVALQRSLLPSLVARIKVMCGMDISESQKPQDGGCRVRVNGRPVELRASTLRGVHGEKVVLRLQAQNEHLTYLEALGFEPTMLRDFRRLLKRRQGMLLVAGPTGSGKTTTLYAALHHLNLEDVNIHTVEDPVEMHISGIHQTQVHDRAGRSFATSLRALLRQDPDILMVGEIRDVETTNIACRAALTGHLVISTLHTQHALGTVARLFDMGVDPWLVAACLNAVLAQRLVRRVCDQCAEAHHPPEELLTALEAHFGVVEESYFCKGRGCAACLGSGTRGRVGVYELLKLDEEFRHALAEGIAASKPALWDYAITRGFKTMEEDAYRKACRGIIPIDEVLELGFAAAAIVDNPDDADAPDAVEPALILPSARLTAALAMASVS